MDTTVRKKQSDNRQVSPALAEQVTFCGSTFERYQRKLKRLPHAAQDKRVLEIIGEEGRTVLRIERMRD